MILFVISCTANNKIHKTNKYQDLIQLFNDFRAIQDPVIIDEVPDYTPDAMAKQKISLDNLQKRLVLIDTSGWSISDRLEYHLVKAEMHGLEFYHKVLRPWSRDPGFYLQTQDGAGPTRVAYFDIDEFPIPNERILAATTKLNALPKVLDQAKTNLKNASGDLAYCALHYMPYEITLYERIYS